MLKTIYKILNKIKKKILNRRLAELWSADFVVFYHLAIIHSHIFWGIFGIIAR